MIHRIGLGAAVLLLLTSCEDSGNSAPLLSNGNDVAAARSDWKDAAKPSIDGTFEAAVEDYLAYARAAAPIALPKMWSGWAYCGSGNFPVELSLSSVEGDGANGTIALTGTARISAELNQPRVASPFSETYADVSLGGSYSAASQVISLTSPDTAKGRRLIASLLIDPRSPDAALMTLAEGYGQRIGRQCSQGILFEQSEAVTRLQPVLDTIAGLYEDRRHVTPGQCPPRYQAWLDETLESSDSGQNEEAVGRALSAAQFAEVFGENFWDLSADNRAEISAVMRGACQTGRDRAGRIAVAQLSSWFSNYKYYQSMASDRLREPVALSWIEWMRGEFARTAAMPMLAPSQIVRVPRTFAFPEGVKTEAFSAEAIAYMNAAQTAQSKRSFAELVSGWQGRFEGLMERYASALVNADKDLTIATLGLDYFLPEAAENYAKAIRDGAEDQNALKEAIYAQAWLTQFGVGACPAGQDAVCPYVASQLDEAIAEFTASAASSLQKSEQPFFENPEGLAQAVSRAKTIAFRYGPLMSREPLASYQAQMTNERMGTQRALASALTEEAEALKTTVALDAFEDRYFLGDELQEATFADLRALLVARRSTTQPFDGYSAARYLNALYNRDFQTLRALDREYLAGLRPLSSLAMQYARSAGPLLDQMLGQRRGQTQRQTAKSLDTLSVVFPLLGTYLVDYQDRYSNCLGPNALSYTITQRTDIVTKNGFGTEISRMRGWTQADRYQIKADFKDQFEALFQTATDSGQARLMDAWLTDGNINRARRGLKSVMQDFACDSPVIIQLEAGMRAYDGYLKSL